MTNAESVKVQPFGTVDASGERKDTPQGTQIYTLIATNQGKNVEQSQQVVVATPAPDAPRIATFTVEPDGRRGHRFDRETDLQTDQTNAATIEPGLGPVGLDGPRDVPAPRSIRSTPWSLRPRGRGSAQFRSTFNHSAVWLPPTT